ncbi:MAG: YbjN domain-containing protein [Magnetococcales bacterium]|nr:YbjN domain-containing protein [Magnetococcales bacterium]MBF0157147.1 YbjN domain-containing protein [Magnetococcales bacterium]
MGGSHDRVSASSAVLGSNPISQIEEYAIAQDWNSERTNEYELWLELPSQWGSLRVWAAFHDDSGFLQCNCYLNLKIPPRFLGRVAEAIALVNERVWLGHFEIWAEETVPVFRIVLPLRGTGMVEEQLEDVMTSIFQETDRFFPVFQWVIWGGKTPQEAVAAAIVDTEGEA